jgi:hypothetical protein
MLMLSFLFVVVSGLFEWKRICAGFYRLLIFANKEATEPRVPFGKVEVITSKLLRSPP